ncbi:tetratricopeptide repeat protein [Actinoallomurus iriomotensis]|uniref:ATP/GTP-binding protein n=1 Tax=Actinoallomurus iriomotensis TaxID=478107 RepID=A0A9W6S2D6_9ACTN|nr:tetratricopeptide repeat protein [Actinoallomurus iriomotensis]GLY85996.1 ATP/GTP-binding protein [Actinoallomurus iriomotensis]
MTGSQEGRAEGKGRVYQASGNQHIIEYHDHGDSDGRSAGGPDSVRLPIVGRPPVVLRDRTEILNQLRESITGERYGGVFVLYGMGGCGKTAVAYTFFRYATAEAGHVGLWVDAADPAGLRAGMLAVAADRGAGSGALLAARNGLRPAADLVWDRLNQSPEPWLLVLDNADDPVVLRDGGWLRASPRGTVIVTTRQAAARWWPGASLQHVGVLPREDAARMLCDLAPHSGTLEQAAGVADRLGRLPLALTLAGSFLAHQLIDPWSMETYGRQLEAGPGADPDGTSDNIDEAREKPVHAGLLNLRLIDRGADPLTEHDSRHLVGRTWQLTLDAFEARGLSEAPALLRLFARLAPEPLPLSVLNHPALQEVVPPDRTEIALRALVEHSLTELVNVAEPCVRTHGVLLDSVSAATPEAMMPVLDRTAARLLDAAVPAEPDAGPHTPRLGLLAPHVLALLLRTSDPVIASAALTIATRLATACHRTADYASACDIARLAAEAARRILSPDDRPVLAADSRTGRALFRLGRYAEAEELLRRVRQKQERLLGPGDPDTLDTVHGLQLVLSNLGRRDEALALLRSTVTRRRASLGPWHPLTLRSRAGLLVILTTDELIADDPDAPLAVPEDCMRHLGSDHTITLMARHNHAWAMYTLGEFATADEEAAWAADEYLQRFGPEHPFALAARQLLARTRTALGDRDTGITLMTGVVAQRERSLGPDHPFTVAGRTLLKSLRSG